MFDSEGSARDLLEVFLNIVLQLLIFRLISVCQSLFFLELEKLMVFCYCLVAVAAAKVASEVKAADIRVLFVKPLVYWTRFFIIATAFSRPQIDAIGYLLLLLLPSFMALRD